MLDRVVVVAGARSFEIAACGHLSIDGVTLEGIKLERPDGTVFGEMDVGGVQTRLSGARYIVLRANGVPLDLRYPPDQIPLCSGRIGEPLD